MEQPRYALYFAPDPQGALWRFGSSVLGYDGATGEDLAFPRDLARIPDWPELTAEPRRYAFHATLKAPFHLKASIHEDAFVDQVAAFAASEKPFTLDGLGVTMLGAFVALTPLGDTTALNAFAGRCVGSFEHVRAALDASDLERRLASPLTARQRVHLERYGYPHVFDDFRFHMTLTGRIDDAERREDIWALLDGLYSADGPGAVAIDSVAIYRQPTRQSRFHVLKRFPLG